MTLTHDQLVVLCERRDMGIVAEAAGTHLDARRLLAGIPPEQVAALRADGRRAVQEMVEANLGVVGLVLARHAHGRAEIRDDLFQEGVIGLIGAAWRYDPTQTTFSTFAYHHVRGTVLAALLTGGGELHLRPGQAKDLMEVRRAAIELVSAGRPATPAAVAAELGRPVEAVSQIMSYTRHSPLPLDANVVDASERAQMAFDKVLQVDVSRYVRMLPPLEQQVIDKLYGLNGQAPSTQQAIALELGTSMTSVRRISDTAHAHLRRLIDRPDSQPVLGLAKRMTPGAGRTVPGCHRPEHRGGAVKPARSPVPRV